MELEISMPDQPVNALADTKGFERILLNLVDNACKYAAEGGRIEIEARNGDRPRVRVRDHGPGIDPEDRDKIFRPFRRASRDADSPNPGLGLGLALCRGLARTMGGELTVERPEEGPGAVFVLELARPG
jgi:signal transduction histidine kinase